MSEYYELEQMLEGLDEEMLVMGAGVIGAVLLVTGLIALVGYIFQSIGLYTIAKRRGIQNPWLAWLPVGNYWIAGSIADHYQKQINGSLKIKRFILLGIGIVGILLSGSVTVDTTSGAGTIIGLLETVLNYATLIFWNWALFDLYSSCKPKNNVLFLVLGVLFGVAVPYFIFACRKWDEGMPQKQEEFRYAYQNDPEPRVYKEPWDV